MHETQVSTDTDVQLVAMTVAKQLKTEHRIDDAPTLADYEVPTKDFRFNGSTDVRVAISLGRCISIDVKQHGGPKPT